MKKNCEVDEILQAQVLSLTSNLGLPFQEKDILEALSFTGGNDIDAALDYLLTVKSSTIKTQTSPKSVEKPIEKQKVQETKNSHSLSNFESSLESSTKDEEFVGILSEEDQFELLTNHKVISLFLKKKNFLFISKILKEKDKARICCFRLGRNCIHSRIRNRAYFYFIRSS